MLENFLEVLENAEVFFFGSLVEQGLFSLMIQLFNYFLVFSVFYSILVVPFGWAIKFLKSRFTK